MSLFPPPIQAPIIERAKEAFGLVASEWVQFMNQLYTGDTGTRFTPSYGNLTVSGTPTVTAAYYKDGQFIDFEIFVTPATSTTSTAGSTYFNLPFDVLANGGCFAVLGLTVAAGVVDAGTNRVYPPSWSAATSVVTITGRARAS